MQHLDNIPCYGLVVELDCPHIITSNTLIYLKIFLGPFLKILHLCLHGLQIGVNTW
jgi:hypothetical protein